MAPAKSKKQKLGVQLTKRKKRQIYTSTRHTTDIEGHANLSSVIETTSVDDFLSNAEAARKNFEAEKGLFCLSCPTRERLRQDHILI
jgi:hypothetical protein